MAELLQTRARVVRARKEIETILEDEVSDIGGPAFSELVRDFETIGRLVEEIQSFGCIIKDVNVGLLDFLAERDGRDVYLCWRFGESQVEYYHELRDGFKGRRLF